MKLYFGFASMHIKSQIQYKTSFFLNAAGVFLLSFGELISICFMFSRFYSVEGFTFREVLLCFGIVLTASGLGDCIGKGFDFFPQMIGNGEFDRILLRPRNEVLQVFMSKMALSRIEAE